MSTAWGCSHLRDDYCDLLKKVCDPGDKGCVLYGKALFSNPESPSSLSFEKKREKERQQAIQDELDNAKFH
jgi:hypothetical protein